MADKARNQTDKELAKIEKHLASIFAEAEKDLIKKAENYLSKFEKLDESKKEQVDRGEITQKEYDEWRKNKLLYGEHWTRLISAVQNEMANCNKTAVTYVNNKTADIYALNYNSIAEKISNSNVKGYSFELVDAETVKKLATSDEIMLPHKELDEDADKRWNAKQVNAQALQGVLQGESIPKIAQRMSNICNSNRAAATRTARTMITGAENSGRQAGMNKAEADGIQFMKIWIATSDGRTRDSHVELNGTEIENGEMFETINGEQLEFPGDWRADGCEVYNCRCSLGSRIIGFKSKSKEVVTEEQTDSNEQQNQPQYNFVDGTDISREWKRRENEFEYEIEDVINAQGYDGLPTVVSESEFNRIVEQSNFIAQRTYTASSAEVVEEYRRQLYYGDWYVDCGVGGAQYGQGMYCAADYTGTLSAGIRTEMTHYQDLNASRFRTETAEIEKNNALEKLLDFSDERVAAIYNRDFARGIDDELRKAARAFAKTIDDKTYKKIENEIAEAIKEADKKYKEVLSMSSKEYSDKYSRTETITLAPDAKIIKYNDIAKMKYNDTVDYIIMRKLAPSLELSDEDYAIVYMNNGSRSLLALDDYEKEKRIIELADKIGSLSTDEWDKKYGEREDELYDIWDKFTDDVKSEQRAAKAREKMNDGAWAALMGYDAINAEGHGESGSYTVILNRTKVIFKEDKKDGI